MNDEMGTRAREAGESEYPEMHEDYYATILEGTLEAIISTDLDEQIIYFNRAAEAMFGYAKDEVLGYPLNILIPKRFHDIHHQNVGGFIHDRAMPDQFQKPSRKIFGLRKNGEEFPIDASISRVTINGRTIATAVMIEASDMVRAVEALRKAKEFTDTALNAQLDTFFIFEPDSGKAIHWNQAFREAVGYSDEEISRLPAPASYYSPEDLERATAFIEKILHEGSGTIEMELVCKNGHKIPTEYQVSLIPGHEGNPTQFVSIGRDITERIKAAEKLKHSEARLKEAQNIAHLGSWELDLVNNNLWWSDEAYHIFGMDPEKFGASYEAFLDSVHPDDREAVDRTYIESVNMKTPYDIIHRLLMPDGSVKYVNEQCETHYDDQDKPLRSIGTVHDITVRMQTEQELEKHRQHLEELVEQRTSELEVTQEKLVSKERLAALGQVIATVGHELRNPLGTIRTSMHTLSGKLQGKDINFETITERIDRNISRCDNIIDELRDFTRLQPLQTKAICFDEWLDAMLDVMAISDDIQLARKLASGVDIDIDNGRIRRVFINLLDNACQALEADNAKGKKEITVSSRKVSASEIKTLAGSKATVNDNYFLEIVVADNGSGITLENLPHLFEPLFSTKAFGVGLGLSIVRLIMEQHGGGVHIASRPDKGTEVFLWLPLKA